jgi:triphosphatase
LSDPGPPAEAARPTPSERLVLELALPPGEAPRLTRLLPGRDRRRARPLYLTWHDTPKRNLAADGLAVVERRWGRERGWRLERIRGPADAPWLPGTPCPVLAEAADAAGLQPPHAAVLAPVATFVGRLRPIACPDGVELTLISGTLGAGEAARPCCRVVLAGPMGPVVALAERLTERLHLEVPPASLPAEAIALAGRRPRRGRGPPSLAPGLSVGEAFAHLVARLNTTLLTEAPHAGPTESEPVHQMRVAVRRLRSAVGLFGKAARCPEVTAAKAALGGLAAVLAPARDWDVFAAGTGHDVAASFSDDRAVRRLLKTAERRRQQAYAKLAEYLSSAEFRRLGIALAALAAARPWELAPPDDDTGRAERLAGSLAGFAVRALDRRLKPLVEAEADVETLPTEALHRLRLNGKRMRYVAEFFAPLFPSHGARRFIRRLTVLQERLGHLNDGAVAAGLMADLGAGRSRTGGLVCGFVAAHSTGARSEIGRAWRRFHRLDPFWN